MKEFGQILAELGQAAIELGDVQLDGRLLDLAMTAFILGLRQEGRVDD